jgi:glycosyltransferase involved in cell wall biosynthesis
VSLLGGVSQKAIRDYLYEADIFFHPAVQEGLSNAVLEAMALGLPVVCTHVGGMAEAIQHGNTGLLVAARDWRGMGDAIRRLAETPDLRRQLGVAAREDVRMRFTAANQQQGFIEFFTGSENSF